MSAHRPLVAGLILALALGAGAAVADNLYKPGSWPALASDRPAGEVGDSLTVLIYETSTASNTTQRGSSKKTRIEGEVANQGGVSEGGRLQLESGYTGAGQTARTDKMVAQISVLVEQVLPNGDLLVSGRQVLNVNGERSEIKIRGRVRPADISSGNTVLSTRIADATIDYKGAGFASRSMQPGVINHILNMLGLM